MAGCSTNETASITGHATLAEVSRYTKADEQQILARAAMARREGAKFAFGFPNPEEKVGKNGEKM